MSRSEEIFDGIASSVIAGRLSAGRQLPSVRALAAAFGISPQAMHPIVKRLCDAGYLVRQGDRLPACVAHDKAAQSSALASARAFLEQTESLSHNERVLLLRGEETASPETLRLANLIESSTGHSDAEPDKQSSREVNENTQLDDPEREWDDEWDGFEEGGARAAARELFLDHDWN
ncbi:GntR family transcriptional regulator [Leifsonia xyli]|uniref:GntR family transcriptional regulator n=1 Tax=Leifsonia xyli TaxID=1575 RepID=UPI0009ECCD8C